MKYTFIYYAGAVLVSFLFGLSIHDALAQATNETVPVPASQLVGQVLTSTEALIGSAISIILIALKWADSIISRRKDSAQKAKFLEWSAKAQSSLKGTDEWIRDTITAHNDDFKQLIGLATTTSPDLKKALESKEGQDLLNKIQAREDEAKAEFDRYYGWASKVSGLDSKDPVIAKLAEGEQFLTPAGPSSTTTVRTTGGGQVNVTNSGTNDSDAI